MSNKRPDHSSIKKPKPQRLPKTPKIPKQSVDQGSMVFTPPPPDDTVEVPSIPVKSSPIDELKKKYGSNDLLVVGKNALKARDIEDAIFALENVSVTHPDVKVKTLLLFDAYLRSGRLAEAASIANNKSIIDAQFDYLCGKLYEQTNRNKKALEYYQAALTKPSVIRSGNEIRNDALYQTALIWTILYRSNPTPDTRIQTLNAWNIVKRTYMATPDHPRFKKANSELASTQ